MQPTMFTIHNLEQLIYVLKRQGITTNLEYTGYSRKYLKKYVKQMYYLNITKKTISNYEKELENNEYMIWNKPDAKSITEPTILIVLKDDSFDLFYMKDSNYEPRKHWDEKFKSDKRIELSTIRLDIQIPKETMVTECLKYKSLPQKSCQRIRLKSKQNPDKISVDELIDYISDNSDF
jgi:hypothetical protein